MTTTTCPRCDQLEADLHAARSQLASMARSAAVLPLAPEDVIRIVCEASRLSRAELMRHSRSFPS